MSFDKYIETLNKSHNQAVKVEWLNADETVSFEFTNAIYDMNVELSVNYQNGSRRTCTITINNDNNKFPINFNNIWMGQKFKLWLGVYLDDKTPCYFPQGVFYVSNPDETYEPSTRTITLNGLDKWAYLDGTLFGKLSGIYQTNINNNLYDATKALLHLSKYTNQKTDVLSDMIDPIDPFLSPYFLTKTTVVNGANKSVLECPYTAIVNRGKTLADVLLEYATILCAHIYYDVNGRLVIEPMINTADDLTDTDKEILWNFTVDEKTFLGLTQTYNFDKVYNDFVVLGNIVNGHQFKGRVQNRNPQSNTCVQKIGLKTKEPYEDNQYVSNQQCTELAKYYAKVDTILQKSGQISSIAMYHLDVNKLVTLSTPNNNMSKELFLINGFNLSTSGTMSLDVTSVNIIKDFVGMEDVVLFDNGNSEYLNLKNASPWFIQHGEASCGTTIYMYTTVYGSKTSSDYSTITAQYVIPLSKDLPDLTGYNTLNVQFGSPCWLNDVSSGATTGYTGLDISIASSSFTTVKEVVGASAVEITNTTISADIPDELRNASVNGKLYINLRKYVNGNSRLGTDTINIKKIWLSIS